MRFLSPLLCTSKLDIKSKYCFDFKRCFVPGCDDNTDTALNQIDASFQQYALPKGKVINSKYSKQLVEGLQGSCEPACILSETY